MWKPKFVTTGVEKLREVPQQAMMISILALVTAFIALFAATHRKAA
jgi:hypothetical protein